MYKISFMALCTLSISLLLPACKPAAPAQTPEMIRPVKTITVGTLSGLASSSFSAEIKPRIEPQLAFRVGGKVIERSVELGQTVKKGQILMRLDPADLQLASNASAAQVASAKANAEVAEAALKRSQDLAKQNFISAGALDQAVGQASSAKAALKAAEANAALGLNATEYGVLKADSDGVVTALLAEVGQIVAAGTPALRMAAGQDKDVVFNIPEAMLGSVNRGTSVTVQLWSQSGKVFTATVRDVASIADPLSRSFAVKAQLKAASDQVPLGATSTASIAAPSQPQRGAVSPGLLSIPLTAVIESQGKTAVWIVESGVVKKQAVSLSVADGADGQVAVLGGLAQGAVVVVAGTHVLTEGQKVKLMAVDAPKPDNAKPQP